MFFSSSSSLFKGSEGMVLFFSGVTLGLLAMRTRKQRKNGAINHTVDTLFSSLYGMFRGFSRALSNISLLTEIICLDWLLALSCSERRSLIFGLYSFVFFKILFFQYYHLRVRALPRDVIALLSALIYF